MKSATHANRTYDELCVGDEASIRRVCAANDLFVFAHASGNLNPLHLPGSDSNQDGRDDAVAPSMWVGALVSACLGNVLPGPGTLYRAQSFQFRSRVHVGDELLITVRVKEKRAKPCVIFATEVKLANGTTVAQGDAEVDAPLVKQTFTDHEIPDLLVQRHTHFDRLIALCQGQEPMPTAVVAPDDRNSLAGALLARDRGLIVPILVGSRQRIVGSAAELGADISGLELIDIEDEPLAAARSIALVHEGRARAVMKGHIHSDELLSQVVKKDGGLRTGRRLSHVFVLDVPGMTHPLLISDAAINIAPDLDTKVSIVQNAIDVALAIGIEKPRVGILSAVETVNPAIPSTLDAAALSKMAERGQIKGGIVDGPLAMDNAIDMQAARTKGITSLVAGRADVLIAPNLEAGNMLAKELTFIAHAEAAGLVVGAKVPVILTSRADDDKSRLASSALAMLFDHWSRSGHPLTQALPRAAE